MKRRLLCFSGIFLLIFISAEAQAAILSQLPSTTTGMAYASNANDDYGYPVEADDFTLISASTITAIKWWGFDAGGGWSGTSTFTFTFYADNSGTPGDGFLTIDPITLISAGVDTVYSSSYAPGGVWAYSADLSVPLVAGTYWLSIFDETTNSSWGWMMSDGGVSYQQLFGAWNPMHSNAAFELTYAPVPLPSAVWLLGSGLVALVALGRRRSTK